MSRPKSPIEHIFYDGDCGVCHWAVKLVARHDVKGSSFRFAPLGGETFSRCVPEEVAQNLPDSLVVQTHEGAVLLRSEGLVHILRRLGPMDKLLATLLSLVPRRLRDFFYDRFAERRHRFARRPEATCPLVPVALRTRFDP